jgi:type I restriction enzyme M protein
MISQPMTEMNPQILSALIWSVADLLRGNYKQSEYGKVILPFTILRRLYCVLESTKEAVLTEYAEKKSSNIPAEPFLLRVRVDGLGELLPFESRFFNTDSTRSVYS